MLINLNDKPLLQPVDDIESITCPKCNSQNILSAKFCRSCGYKVNPIDFVAGTHRGMVRDGNEDAAIVRLLSHGIVLIAVCDGMGGEESGEVASAVAITKLLDLATDWANSYTGTPPEDHLKAWLTQTVTTINHAVIAEAAKLSNGMGATLAFALIVGQSAYIAHVGDARIYSLLICDGQPVFLRRTKDHSLVQRLVDLGQIFDEERYTHPERSVVLRSIGDAKTCQIDVGLPLAFNDDDWLLVCSDGLWEMVRDKQIAQILHQANSADEAVRLLIQAANQNGGADNIGVAVAHKGRLTPSPDMRGQPSKDGNHVSNNSGGVGNAGLVGGGAEVAKPTPALRRSVGRARGTVFGVMPSPAPVVSVTFDRKKASLIGALAIVLVIVVVIFAIGFVQRRLVEQRPSSIKPTSTSIWDVVVTPRALK